MNTFPFVILLASVVACSATGVPTFSWLKNPDPVLKITYPNGQSDIAVLKSFNPIPVQSFERQEDVDTCIYDGFLITEKDVYVTLTGCAHTNTFNIQFRSQNLEHHMFSVVDGNVEAVESVYSKMNGDGAISDVTLDVPVPQLEPSLTGRALDPNGYQATFKIRYDENFNDKFGADSVNTIRRVVAQAQNMWKWPSLTTSVTFLFDPSVDAVAGRFAAANDTGKAAVYSTAKHNINLMMAYRNNKAGVVGMAQVGTVCSSESNAKLRIALCEYYGNDLKAGEIVAHEVGHNMNMKHDFDKKAGNERRDSKGNTCTGIGGVMDYYGKVNKWSTCSVEDFTALINKPGFCLKSN